MYNIHAFNCNDYYHSYIALSIVGISYIVAIITRCSEYRLTVVLWTNNCYINLYKLRKVD